MSETVGYDDNRNTSDIRRVISRRINRCELGLISAVLALLQRDKSLFDALSVNTRFRLDASLVNVS